MAADDIMPWRSGGGGPGSTVKVHTYDLLADQAFHRGEGVLIDANGMLALAGDGPDVGSHLACVGIAAEPAQGMATDAAGTTNPGFAPRGVWIFGDAQEFITHYYTTDTDETAVWTLDPLHTNIGDPVGLMLNTSGAVDHWGVTIAGDNLDFYITAVLDANRQPIHDLTTEGFWVVFCRRPIS